MDIREVLQAQLGPIADHVDAIHAQIAADAATRAAARGIKDMREVLPLPGVPTAVALPPPDQGFAWNLKLITGRLTGIDSVAAYIANDVSEVPNNRLIGYAPPPGAAPNQNVFVISWSSNQGLLKPGEGVVLQTSGAFRFSGVMLFAFQVPAEMVAKII